MADAGISSWEAKYFYDFWRPITAICAGLVRRQSQYAGRPAAGRRWAARATTARPATSRRRFRRTLRAMRPSAAAVFRMIADFYGTDKIPFTFISDEFNGLTFDINGTVRPIRARHFDTLSQAMEENGQSRIYLGIHYSFDKVAGINEGVSIGDYVFQHALRAKPRVQQFATGADTGGGPHVRVQETVTGRFISDFLAYDSAFRGGVRVANARRQWRRRARHHHRSRTWRRTAHQSLRRHGPASALQLHGLRHRLHRRRLRGRRRCRMATAKPTSSPAPTPAAGRDVSVFSGATDRCCVNSSRMTRRFAAACMSRPATSMATARPMSSPAPASAAARTSAPFSGADNASLRQLLRLRSGLPRRRLSSRPATC